MKPLIFTSIFLLSFAINSCITTPIKNLTKNCWEMAEYIGTDSLNQSILISKLDNEIKNNEFEITVNISDSLKNSDKGIPIKISFKNTSNTSYLVRNPSRWVNSNIDVSDSQGRILPTIKLKVDPKTQCHYQLLKANDSLVVFYDYSLDKLLGKLDNGNYQISLKYHGLFKTSDEKYDLRFVDLKSNTKEFFVY